MIAEAMRLVDTSMKVQSTHWKLSMHVDGDAEERP
jgi:hypothetical protein